MSIRFSGKIDTYETLLFLEERIGGLATALATVPEDAPVDAELLLENVVEGILVSGPVHGTMVLACAFCAPASRRAVGKSMEFFSTLISNALTTHVVAMNAEHA